MQPRISKCCRSLVAILVERARVALASASVTLVVSLPANASFSDATPADNNQLKPALITLVATHDAGVIGGVVAPGWFGVGFEIAATTSDFLAKHTAPVFSPPAAGSTEPFNVFPNARRFNEPPGHNCVYKFGTQFQPRIDDDNNLGISEDYASLFGINYNLLDNVWSDLGAPDVWHPQADVTVNVNHPFLSASEPQLQLRPEFPEGRHALAWSAETKFNPITDVALPVALLVTFTASENYLQNKLGVIGTRRLVARGVPDGLAKSLAEEAAAETASRIFRLVGLASEVGIVVGDISNSGDAYQWYLDTSEVGAVNRAMQTLTVWDVHTPYFIDQSSLPVSQFSRNFSIEEQTFEIEATDFGGVKFDRVADTLRARFQTVDDCGKQFDVRTDVPRSTLLPIGPEPSIIEWYADEIDGGPYPMDTNIASNQIRTGEQIRSILTQRVSVVDTQAPLLIPPAGFARYEEDGIDLTSGGFPIGRPRVVDLADPSPSVSNNAPDFLPGPPDGVDGVRYTVAWDAVDQSQNSAAANTSDPASLTQTITLKRPGTNTTPTATSAIAETRTARAVAIQLNGVDVDVIDGRTDPLEFRIRSQPDNGQFEAPLYPYFIEDFRLTPVGEREEGDELTRISPLRHLADQFRLALHSPSFPPDSSPIRGTLLNQEICVNPTAESQAVFGGVIPVDFVYQPKDVHVDDDGNFYILDSFFRCGVSSLPGAALRLLRSGELQAIPRISKWNEAGELVDVITLLPVDGYDDYESVDCLNRTDQLPLDGHVAGPGTGFSVDHTGRFWMDFRSNQPAIGFATIVTHCSVAPDLTSFTFHGASFIDSISTNTGLITGPVVGDGNADVLYQSTDENGIFVRRADEVVNLASTAPEDRIGVLDRSQIDTGGGFGVKVDSDGNVYVLESDENRIHKYRPTIRTGPDSWEIGEYIGWLGSCASNRLNPATGVPYNRCDEQSGASKGFACTDATCERAADSTGTAPGQFNSPAAIEIDPRNVLYVADTENERVQRFGADGVFAGQAKSTGSGINQGDEPGFVLGNMGKPRQLSVNSTSLFVMEPNPADGDEFVHIFKTLPFSELTESSAVVTYVSDFNFQGDDSFTYVVDDGIDESEPAAVSVSVSRAFNPPENLRAECFRPGDLSSEVPCNLSEDDSLYVRLSATDVDGFLSDAPNGLDTHTFNIVEPPQHGTLLVDDPQLVFDNSTTLLYTPEQDYNGIDRFVFEVFDGVNTSAEQVEVEFTIAARPDPVAIRIDSTLTAARGFPRTFVAEYSDPDNDPNNEPDVLYINWGDGEGAFSPAWFNSGNFDVNGNETSPRVQLGVNNGLLVGSHSYEETGTYLLRFLLSNPATSVNLPDTIESRTVNVFEATVVSAELTSPMTAVDPDTAFPINIEVVNNRPDGWAGLVAENVRTSIDIPEGISLQSVDVRCAGTNPVECDLGDLAQGEATTVELNATISLADARRLSAYTLMYEMFDDGPNIISRNVSVATINISDMDNDGVIDVDDRFPRDPEYAIDTDGDGLADGWEHAFGFDPLVADDTSADTDGDGYTLLDEFLNRSFPNLAEVESAVAGETFEAVGVADDRFGYAVAGGDLNGDSYADIVVGAPSANSTGSTYITYGTPIGVTASSPQRLSPGSGVVGYGRTLAVGDWDDNGLDDLAIAHNNGVHIHYSFGELNREPDSRVVGLQPLSNMGLALHSADIDGDDVDDLIATASTVATGSQIFFWLSTRDGPGADPTIIDFPGELFGESIAVGDIDGDGRADLFVGSPGGPQNDVFAYLGRDNDWTTTSDTLQLSFTLLPPGPTSQFGYRVVSGSDVGGDGVDDLIVSDYSQTGAVYFYESADNWLPPPGASFSAAPTQTLFGLDDGSGPGDSSGDQFGVAMTLGHLDSDAYADLVVGANRAGANDEGQIRILRGGPGGFDAMSGEIENGTTPFDMLGYSAAIVGDIDRDGFSDIAAGAPDILDNGRAAPDGGYARLFYHRFIAVDPSEDLDNDGVSSAVDNCPAAANTNQTDLDDDGQGDACDSDIDGDGTSNEFDNCPLLASTDLTDLDGDAVGDVCDDDDDGDGITDDDDAFPRNALYFADSDGDGLPDAYEQTNGLDLNNAVDASLDLDGDGRINLLEFQLGFDISTDDVAPELIAPDDIVAVSTGPFTSIDVGSAFAVDVKDGTLIAESDIDSPFIPGRHFLSWQVADTAGNVAVGRQQVDVIPMINFVGTSGEALEGYRNSVSVSLNGVAAEYPVTVPYSVSGTAQESIDYVGLGGEIEITQGEVATIDLDVLADSAADDNETIVLRLGQATNAVVGLNNEFTITIRDDNVRPSVEIAVVQDSIAVSEITQDGGLVSIMAMASDPNERTVFSYDWGQSSADLLQASTVVDGQVLLDPGSLGVGVYRLEVLVTDDGIPALSASHHKRLRVIASAPLLSGSDDSDGDGVADLDEGAGDSNGNGVSDYLDPSDRNHLLIAKTGGRAYLQVPAGQRLQLGAVAMASGDDAALRMADIEQYGDNGRTAPGADDTRFRYPGGIYDFEVSGISDSLGYSLIVVPQTAAVPNDPSYRKFLASLGWSDFVVDANNRLASAPGSVDTCPAPGHALYVEGLFAGDHCVQLRIEDGGPNDSDGETNGVITDPGGVAMEAVPVAVTVSSVSTNDQPAGPDVSRIVVARFAVNVNSPDVELSSLMLKASGTGDDSYGVSSVEVWIDTNANGTIDRRDSVVGAGRYVSDDAALELRFSEPYMLPMGETQFIVSYRFMTNRRRDR